MPFERHVFLLGAAKCGTTFLRDSLAQHPGLLMSSLRNRFFGAEYDRGLDFYARNYFTWVNAEVRTGEARHRNLLLPYVPWRICDAICEPYFIVLLRDPVDRVFSH